KPPESAALTPALSHRERETSDFEIAFNDKIASQPVDEDLNAESVSQSQPRVARFSGLPWVRDHTSQPNPERVQQGSGSDFSLCNPFRVDSLIGSVTQGSPAGAGQPWAVTVEPLRG